MKKELLNIFSLLLLLSLAACTEHELLQDDEQVTLRYTVSLPQDAQTRTIGDGSAVDELIVGVFEEGATTGVNFFFDVVDGKASPEIPLFKNRNYNLVFWAQRKDNGVYNTDDLSHIKIDYSNYPQTLEDAIALDAFFATEEDVTPASQGGTITLTRPFAMLNIGASGSTLEEVDKVELTIDKLYTSYHPLSETLVGEDVVSHTFTFEELQPSLEKNGFTDASGTAYTYVASAYLLVPADYAPVISARLISVDENKEESIIKEIPKTQLGEENLTSNYTTNIGVALTESWNGEITITTLKPEDDGIIHIDTAEKLAFLMKFGYTAAYAKNPQQIHLCKDLDMQGSMARAANYKLENVVFDGGNFTLYNLPMSLFGEATNLQVKDLTLSKASIMDAGHTGALVDTLKASAAFANITLQDINVTTSSGAAGGMVGYIVRKSEKERSEQLEVVFDNCQIENATISGSASEGKFVGLLSGYDHQETLNFKAGCTAEGITLSHNASYYVDSNKSCWQNSTSFTNYSAFLGNETYCRGTVMYGENRYWPKWDGERKVEPLLANATYDAETTAGNNKYAVYSPFDLAGVRSKTASPTAIYLMQDIDMFGQGVDGNFNIPSNFTQSAYTSSDDNPFTPFNYVATLDGLNHSIYNLSIYQPEQTIGAFVLYASGTTVHKNINFRNCCTVSTHKEVTTDAKAYGAILLANAEATYTMENVHAYDCKVFALQKIGTLGARINGTSTLKDNSVNNCYVENYECKITERFESGSKKISAFTIDNVYADFYPYGEVGGMYGFIQGNATLTNCKVNETTVHAIGQDDKMATIEASGIMGNMAKIGVLGLGYYLVPGRHVSTLIGNIRATGTVTLTGCSVDEKTQCTNRWDKHNTTYTSIGQAYIVKFVDSEGSVTVDGAPLTLADCNKNTKR
ncbi:MAG: hypothetical protein IJ511_07510 [Bacteroides sp.]|nr:hypothetical protein [Bacteroides sp.]